MGRKRGPIRVLLGLLMLVAGALGVVVGIAGAVNARASIEDDAVASAPLGQPTSFEAPGGERYTVYVIAGRAPIRSSVASSCETGGGARFSGSRQGTSVTLGNASSVGRFDAPAGTVDIFCGGPTTDQLRGDARRHGHPAQHLLDHRRRVRRARRHRADHLGPGRPSRTGVIAKSSASTRSSSSARPQQSASASMLSATSFS